MDLFAQIRSAIEDADDQDGAVDNLVSRMGMSTDQARDVLATPFTAELCGAMYPEGWLSFLTR